MSNDIVVIADTQVTSAAPLDHIHALAKYIWKHKPKHIIHIGDALDFESLSFYASPLESEGRRLVDDLKAGLDALNIIPKYIEKMNKKAKRKKYVPELSFITGNHEERLNTRVKKNPWLEGLIDLKGEIEAQGWKVYDFLEPMWIDDIMFVHYLQNTQTGKAIGGGIENKLNKHPHSFVHGHQQWYQFGRRQTMDGRPHFGVCAGAFYIHDEDYRGFGNTEIRGFAHMKSFTNRYNFKDYDIDFVSMERLLEMYN